MLVELIIFAFLIITSSGSALHGPCEGNEQCGTLDTYCNNGTCVCKDDFVVFYDHCVQLASPHISCTHKSSCNTALGQKGFCKNHKCACKSFHHFYNRQCIKSKGLDEKCESDHQCYCGQDCSNKIECANGTCACKQGFKMYSRRCIPDPHAINLNVETSVVETSSSVAVSLTTYSISRLLVLIFFIQRLQYLY